MKNPNSFVVIKIAGQVTTSPQGIQKLMDFYYSASQHTEKEVRIDFYDLKWIDANLMALYEALVYKLEIENKLVITSDFDFLFEKISCPL